MRSSNNGSLLNKIFKLDQLKTNVRTEFIAGLTTFITMAYIIIVHPSLMKAAGMPAGPVTVMTIVSAAIFSILMGVYANRPFAVAPAMGGNAFFAYTIVASGAASWQTGIGMVFIAGIIFLLLTLLGIRETIAKVLPKSVKNAMAAAVGIYIIGLGLSNAGIIVPTKTSIGLASLHSPTVLLAFIGLSITLALMSLRVRGAVFFGILITTVIGIPMGITKMPTSLVSLPPDPSPILFQVDWLGALKWSFFPLIFTFFTGEFFSTMGTVLGVGGKAKLLDENGNLPDIQKPFIVDSIAMVGGSAMGMTTVTAYVESASGVEVGGRSGLTAVSTGLIFLVALFLTPLFLAIPAAATAPALVAIGLSMLQALKNLDLDNMDELLSGFMTILMTAFTFSIANGIVFGILSFVVIKLLSGKIKEIPIGLYILCIPLVYYLWLK